MVNERIGDLARHLHDRGYNPARLDFKKLKAPLGPLTHECDAWAKGGAKRLFGYFEEDAFIIAELGAGLH